MQRSQSSFFFQAEDGIRDKLVTGVQTCALPILVPGVTAIAIAGSKHSERLNPATLRAAGARPIGHTMSDVNADGIDRSEERRVGKGWRTRWMVVNGDR